ncbi:hypothetical protein EC533_07120 [Helicobacter pylori]|nr:hypothetical protein EC533_07120 [Helicobacter pylori]
MLGFGIIVGGYPGKEITDYEITISDHSFIWPSQRHYTKILALAQARVKSMVASVLNKQYKNQFYFESGFKSPASYKNTEGLCSLGLAFSLNSFFA